MVYLVHDPDGALRPAWVAASAHDLGGADLRRRWDDPQLRREGDHPVIHPGAGSHSGAFVPGDYVVSVELPALRRIVVWLQAARRRLLPWTAEPGPGRVRRPVRRLRPRRRRRHRSRPRPHLAHRGDLRRHPVGPRLPPPLGPGHPRPVRRRTRPAGPRYSRTGTLRPSWADPLGWGGLAAVPATPVEEEAHLRARIDTLAVALRELDAEIDAERVAVRGLTAQARSLAAATHTRALRRERVAEAARRERALAALVARRAQLAEERAAHAAYLAAPHDPGPPDAHLRHPHLPYAAAADLRSRFLRVWAAVSTPVLVLGLGGLLRCGRRSRCSPGSSRSSWCSAWSRRSGGVG